MKLGSILSVLFLIFSLKSHSQILPIHKTSKYLVIDGDLIEWNTPFLGPFLVHNSGARATQKTFVSFLWNNENLYIGYRSEDSRIIGSAKDKDSQIFYTDDLVEFFIDPDGDGQNYVEIGVNAFSTNYDLLIECISPVCGGWKTSTSFTVLGMETASKITKEGFCTEIKIPFASLQSIQNGNFNIPKTGTKWKGSAFKIDYGNTTEYLALHYYKSLKFGFHSPKEFGVLEFIE